MTTPIYATTHRRAFLRTVGLGGLACCAARARGAAPRLVVPARGVIPAALTPFDASGQIVWPEFRSHIAALAAVGGVTAIMVNGAAAQDAALDRNERRRLVAEALATVGDRTPIIAALRESAEMSLADLTQDATAEGATALMLMPPRKKEAATAAGALERLQIVTRLTHTPVALYQTVYETETLARLANEPSVFAVKEGSGDPAAFERNLRALKSLQRPVAVWSTNSRWLLADLALGADGVLSGLGSIAADLLGQLVEAVWRSDLAAARRVNDRLFPLVSVFYSGGTDAHSRMKYALQRLGRWTGAYVRPPLTAPNAAERAEIDKALLESGLLQPQA